MDLIQVLSGTGHSNPVYSKHNGPPLPHNQKVGLDVDLQHADTTQTKPTTQTSINLHKPGPTDTVFVPPKTEFSVDKLSKKVNAGPDNQKFILLSPMYGSKGNTSYKP